MKYAYLFLAAFILPLFCLFSSCKSDKDSPINKEYIIKGVNLYDANAEAIGKIGIPEDITRTEGLKMFVFPVPCHNQSMVALQLANTETVTIKTTWIHVLYPDAPSSFTFQKRQIPIIVENKSLAGKEALSDIRESPPTFDDDEYKIIRFDVADLPKGFYKIFVETGDGKKLSTAIFKD